VFDLGIQELIVIFIVALIVFGPKRLPELGKTLGKGILELRKAMEGVKAQMNTELEPPPVTTEPAPEPAEKKKKPEGEERKDNADGTVHEEKKGDTVDGR
jgi:TatA/E family protein of Tat protein translocase